jgi:hypothetical protein
MKPFTALKETLTISVHFLFKTLWAMENTVGMMIGNPVATQPQKKQNHFRNHLRGVRRLMFIMIGEMQNFSTSISGILFGDTNVRKTGDKVPSSAMFFLNGWENIWNFSIKLSLVARLATPHNSETKRQSLLSTKTSSAQNESKYVTLQSKQKVDCVFASSYTHRAAR